MIAIAMWFLGPIGRWVLIAGLGFAAFKGYVWNETRIARAEARAEVMRQLADETAKESERRQGEIAKAKAEAGKAVATLAETEARNNDLLERNAALSAANDGNSCLDPAARDRLQRLDAPGQPASPGAPLPPRRPAD